MFPGLSGIARNLRAFPRVQMRDVRSLPPAEVAIASILAAGLWALQTRSWRARAELHMKTARIKSTNRASRIGGTTRQEHRAGECRRCREAVVLRRQPSRARARGTRARSSY